MKKLLSLILALSIMLCACAAQSDTENLPSDTTEPVSESVPETSAEEIGGEEPAADVDEPATAIAPADSDSDSYIQSDSSQVEMKTEFESYPVGTESVKVIITNNSGETFFFGADAFWFQMFDGGEWVNVPFNLTTWAVDDVEGFLDPDKSVEFTRSLMTEYYDYAPGRYRVVLSDQVLKLDDNALYAEFELE